jgi:hypothetical protein
MDKPQEQILMLMLMDLVDKNLLTMEEAETAKRFYLKNEKPNAHSTADSIAA